MFDLVAPYEPAGDQPQAIAKLSERIVSGSKDQVLLGVTGSGKTFTVANVIKNVDKPTLVISHNKTLAAQLYAEFKSFFPQNAVEYFVSYFDYYQPEAYIPRTDTFIEKDSSRNEEIERLRLSAMSSLFSRRDVVVVASVSCIYGIGSKEDYEEMIIPMRVGASISREQFLSRLVSLQYDRNDIAFERGHFRVRGDTVEVRPAGREDGLRVEFFGDEIERITRFEPLTGAKVEQLEAVVVFPAKQFVTTDEKMRRAMLTIREELGDRIAWFEKEGKLLEAQRIKQRTEFDLEMMAEMGICSGIENYSRHISGRPPGSRPNTLFDFFPKDFLLVIDESHATVPQIGAMYEGDRSRKTVLVEHGFRLPSALDNRPLNFPEFQGLQNQTIYVSATPAGRELQWARASAGAESRRADLPVGVQHGRADLPVRQGAGEAADHPTADPTNPEGITGNSPAFQRRVKGKRDSSPEGTAEHARGKPMEGSKGNGRSTAVPSPLPMVAPVQTGHGEVRAPAGEVNYVLNESNNGQTVPAGTTAPGTLTWQPNVPQPGVVELVVRPTGLVDPKVTIKPLKGQIDDLIEECRKRADQKERILVTTLTKRTAEELTDYLRGIAINVQYLHSEIDAIERVEILRSLRKGEFDVLVGINLLREGLDLPEVSLVAILDADKEGFLRSETSLIQTSGRAARHLNGEVILYADVMTGSIKKFLAVTEYRRQKQLAYNKEHNITPRSVSRAVEESLATYQSSREGGHGILKDAKLDVDITATISELESEMLKAAEELQFEKAALLRDQIKELKRMIDGEKAEETTQEARGSYRRQKRARR